MKKKPAVPAPKPVIIPKLSKQDRKPRFVKCTNCRAVCENDLDTMHAQCEACGAVMENISHEAALNLKEQWDAEKQKEASSR